MHNQLIKESIIHPSKPSLLILCIWCVSRYEVVRNNSQIPFSNPPLQLQLEQIKSAANWNLETR